MCNDKVYSFRKTDENVSTEISYLKHETKVRKDIEYHVNFKRQKRDTSKVVIAHILPQNSEQLVYNIKISQ